jgi:invasion protein IalB
MRPIIVRLGLSVTLMLVPISALSQTEKKAAPPDVKSKDLTLVAPKNVDLPTQGWLVNCAKAPEGMLCKATQSIGVPETKQLLAAVAVFKSLSPSGPGSPGYAMTLQLPHGLFLPAGASVQIDAEAAQAVAIETCDQRGCFASLPIADKALAAMRKGKALAITFQNLSKSNVKVQLPLAGFPDALAKL